MIISFIKYTFFLLYMVALCPDAWGKWAELKDCELVSHASNDGDSFRVKTNDGSVYQFRLYFVDTPEVGYFYPNRVKDQARYFGISDQSAMRYGERASRFTKAFLRGKFTVLTEWKDAWGAQKRYAAIVYRKDESLIERLVEEGLVRIHGFKTRSAWEGGLAASDYVDLLKSIEQTAKQAQVGAWGNRSNALKENQATVSFSALVERSDSALIDINSAAIERLKSLPGVGEVLAGRIIESRPYQSTRELLDIKGIGTKLFANIEPMVVVGFDSKPQKTAAFYVDEPLEWSGREIELSISALIDTHADSPDGFCRLLAETTFYDEPGGTIPLYVKNERLNDARSYFRKTDNPLVLRVRFFKFHDEWVVVLTD